MTNEDLSLWQERIKRAESVQQQQHVMWRNSLEMYNCVYFDKLYGGFDPERVDVHFANWYINNVVYMTYFRDPWIFCRTETNRFSAFAATMERVVNKEWSQLEIKEQMKRIILSSSLMPPGWMKIGYNAKIGQDVSKLEEEKEKGLIKQIKDMVKGVLNPERQMTPEELGELSLYIQEESVFGKWIPSWNMLMPEGYHLISDMPFLVEIEDISVLDFNANPLYKNKDKTKPTRKLNYSGTSHLHSPSFSQSGMYGNVGDDTAFIRLYHVWDRRTHRRMVLSKDGSDIHFEGAWAYDVHGYPYEPMIFDETLPSLEKSSPYPPNLLVPIMPQVIEQSQSRTQMVKWRKRSSVMVLVQKGLTTDEDIKQLEETEGVQICYVSNISAFQMTNTGNLPSDVFRVNDIIMQDLQMGTNMGQMMFQAQAGQRTATQAQIGQMGLELKSSARIDVVEGFTKKIAKKLCALMWQFYDKEKVGEMLGEKITEDMWPALPSDPQARKRIINELQIRIDAGSTAPPKDESVERKQYLDAISIAANIAPEKLNKDEALKSIFKTFKYIKDIDKLIVGDEQIEAQTAMRENELMMQGHPQTVSPGENHEVHVQVHTQAAGNELVDAHILDHGQYMGINTDQSAQQQAPQEGDTRSPVRSTNPELYRQGMTKEGDMYQANQNMGAMV